MIRIQLTWGPSSHHVFLESEKILALGTYGMCVVLYHITVFCILKDQLSNFKSSPNKVTQIYSIHSKIKTQHNQIEIVAPMLAICS